MQASDGQIFVQKAEQYLQGTLKGEVMTWAEHLVQKGIQQGLQQGEYNLLIRLLTRKFKAVPAAIRQKLAQADAETLLNIAERVLEIQTLDEIFEAA